MGKVNENQWNLPMKLPFRLFTKFNAAIFVNISGFCFTFEGSRVIHMARMWSAENNQKQNFVYKFDREERNKLKSGLGGNFFSIM